MLRADRHKGKTGTYQLMEPITRAADDDII